MDADHAAQILAAERERIEQHLRRLRGGMPTCATSLDEVAELDRVAPTVPPAATWIFALCAGAVASTTASACSSVIVAALTFISTGV